MNRKLRIQYREYDITNLPNPYFQEIREKEINEVLELGEQIRLKLLENWRTKKQPLGGGNKTDKQIIKDFRNLSKLDTSSIQISDVQGNNNVLKFFGKQPSGINQYFPEMLDTQISIGKRHKSVMDVIKTKESFEKFFESVIYNDRMYNFTKSFQIDEIPTETYEFLKEYKLIQIKDRYKLPLQYKVDNQYYKLNKKTIKYVRSSVKEYEQTKLFPTITQAFRLGGGSQPVSNFSSGISKFLIIHGFKYVLDNDLIENNTFVVLDTSTGWGGRLVGLLSCYTEIRKLYFNKTNRQLRVVYLTTDPYKNLNKRYKDIIYDWFKIIEPDTDKQYFKYKKTTKGSETKGFMSFCKKYFQELGVSGCSMGLTSPPYYNRERYSDDHGQSWIKYGKSYELWSERFLKRTIFNIKELLVSKGVFYMNVSNINVNNKILPLQSDTIKYSQNIGLTDLSEFKMLLSTMTGNDKNKETGGKPKNVVNLPNVGFKKYEPIYILKKQ